jgi:hypothetical protein
MRHSALPSRRDCARARRRGVAAYILRRQAVLERLIARLMNVAPGRWALKGGLALEIRLGEYARPSVDLDADHAHGASAARPDLERAVAEDLGDRFAFAIAGSEELREGGVSLAVRDKIECSLAGRPFEPLQMDVTVAPPDPWDAEPARRPGLLAEFHLGPVEVLHAADTPDPHTQRCSCDRAMPPGALKPSQPHRLQGTTGEPA